MEIRLNKFISQAGVASRREADRLIAEGRVKVNGLVIQSLGHKIAEEKDLVEVDGRPVKLGKASVYVLLNKPRGYLVTRRDPFRRPTVLDLLSGIKERVYPVGRLDVNSEGLLLLTNDGELAHRLMHPRYGVKKVYRVLVKGKPDEASLGRLGKGVVLDGKKTADASVSLLGGSAQKSWIKVEIYEGRKREVRRMCEAVGHRVLTLQRIRLGSLSLGSLRPGHWRLLRPHEVQRLKKIVGLNAA